MHQPPNTSSNATRAAHTRVAVEAARPRHSAARLPPALPDHAIPLADHEQLTRVLERSRDGQLIIDRSGIVLQANTAMSHMLGMAPGGLCAMPLAAVLLPDQCAVVARALEQIVRADAADVCLDGVFLHANATPVPLAIQAGLLWWHNQPAVHMVVRRVDHLPSDHDAMRQQMAYELHDGLAQIVVGVHQHLQAFAAKHRSRSPQQRADLNHLLALARDAVLESRRVIAGMRATPLDTWGLVGALAQSADVFRARGWAVSFHEALGDSFVPPAWETVLFCVTQEALMNIAKHARAQHISIMLERSHAAVRLVIGDDGCGFEPSQRSSQQAGYGVGLASMRERVRVVGGQYALWSAPDQGTQIVVELPIVSEQKG